MGNTTPKIINIYNFIRKTIYADGKFMFDDFDTVQTQIDVVKQYGLPATYAIKYDALIDENYQNMLKEKLDEYDEIGIWWEIDKTLCEKAGVTYRTDNDYALHVSVGQSIGYSPEDRKKMIDVYMDEFKRVFGYYPKSVGSFVMDIISYEYFKEKYGLVAGAICRDQIGIDGFTLWGGYFNQAYYPSKINEYMPAQNKENQLDLPIFRLLGPDPIYSLEGGLRPGVGGIFTLEPVAKAGHDQDVIDWYFNMFTEEDNLGFQYAQVGQENTYLWDIMEIGYDMQLKIISKLEKEGKVRVETLSESGQWYQKKYDLTPPTTIASSTDWNKELNLKTLWYESRFYRTSFIWDNNTFAIRDLFMFNENYKSRYYNDVVYGDESICDTLPVLNAHYWKCDEVARPEIKLVNSYGEAINVSEPNFNTVDISTYKSTFSCLDNKEMIVTCKENKISFNLNDNDWKLFFNIFPVLKGFEEKRLICEHNDFIYNIYLEKGKFIVHNDGTVSIIPEEGQVDIILSDKFTIDNENEFYSNEYKTKPESIDNFTPRYRQEGMVSKLKPQAFKPIITPEIALGIKSETQVYEIKNPNGCGEIRYTLDGSEPNENSLLYTGPIIADRTLEIKASVFAKHLRQSRVSIAKYYQTYPLVDIKAKTPFTSDKSYNHNGAYDLINGKKGTIDYAGGSWLGCLNDMDVTVDLGEVREISKASIGLLQCTRQWIFFPLYAEFEISVDGKEFVSVGKVDLHQSVPRKEIATRDLVSIFDKTEARYVRVFVKNNDKTPEWSHVPGFSPAYMFLDHITVE